MNRPNRGWIVFLLAGVLGAMGGTASADAPASGAAAPEPPAPAERKFTPDKPALFISGSVADSPFWSVGVTLPAGVTVSVGANIEYNGKGLTAPGRRRRAATSSRSPVCSTARITSTTSSRWEPSWRPR
ncbi:MAG TPA: hypothetical protein VF469_29210 [Kofleriaceae bacterium]